MTTEMQLSVLRNQLSSALGATKQKHLQTNRFGRAFERNCFRRVVFSWWNFGVQKLIDRGVLFDTFAIGVSIF